MKLRIFGTAPESIVDGPGFRYALFAQGCPHHCPGCHNPKSHDPEGGFLRDSEEIIREFGGNPLLRGITLSGGEPFMQAEACALLAQAAHRRGLDVWTYTGFTLETLLEQNDPAHRALLAATDVLVDGPYLEAQRRFEGLPFRGSANQRLLDMQKSLAQGKAVRYMLSD